MSQSSTGNVAYDYCPCLYLSFSFDNSRAHIRKQDVTALRINNETQIRTHDNPSSDCAYRSPSRCAHKPSSDHTYRSSTIKHIQQQFR